MLQSLGQDTEGDNLKPHSFVTALQFSRPSTVSGTQQAPNEGQWKND